MRLRLLVLALSMATMGTASAQAGPVVIGEGTTPSVVASPDGTLHAVWQRLDAGGHVFVHYCKIAPGGTTCAESKEFDYGDHASLNTQILRENDGTIDIVSILGLDNATVTPAGEYLYRSTAPEAAGNTWAARKLIADSNIPYYESGAPSNVATFGPGNFQIGWVSDTAGSDVQYAATTGPKSSVYLNDLMPGAPFQRMGLIDSTTAMIVRRDFDSDGGEFQWRLSPADGDPRIQANWQPPHEVTGISSELEFAANGISPPVVADVESGAGTDEKVYVRRFSTDGQSLQAPVLASDIDYIDDITTTLDPASNVHLAFISERSGSHDINYLASPTGTSWPAKPIVLSYETPTGPMVIGASADGNGAVFWRRGKGTGSDEDDDIVITRVNGPASAFPPADVPPGKNPPPADPACVKTPSLGIAKFLSTGCFTRVGTTSKLTTTAPFRLNGIVFDPKGKTVTIDEKTRKLSTPSGVAATIPPINFGTSAREWTFPATGTFDPGLIDFDKGGLGGALLKLKLAGDAHIILSDAKTTLTTHMQLPVPLQTVNGDVTLKTDNFSSIKLDGLHVTAKELPYGFHDLDLLYVSDPPTWIGTLGWKSVTSGDDFSATIKIVNGGLEFVKVDGKFDAPGKKIYPPYVFMRYLGLKLQVKPTLMLEGSTILTGGPSFGDTALISIGKPFSDFGTVGVTLTPPFKLDAKAPIYILGFKLGQGELHYTFPGEVSFAANASIGSCSLAGASMSLSGFVNAANPPKFNAQGKATACLFGLSVSVDGVLSSKGIAACGHFGLSDTFSVDAGAGHLWSESGVSIKLKGCSIDPYVVSARRQAGGARTFNVAAGLKQLNVQLTGDSGPPAGTLTGPNGAAFAAPAAGLKGTRHVAVPDADGKTMTLLVAQPPAGTYTWTPAAGSPNVTAMELSKPAPKPSAKGTLKSLGKRKQLTWSVADRGGNEVEFFEEGDGVLKSLGTPKSTKGTLRFTPAVVRGGARKVTVVITQDGLPLRKQTLANYVVPRPAKPGLAKRLKAKHVGTRLVLTWVPAPRAATQDLTVNLGDGTKKLFHVKGRVRTLRLPAITKTTTGSFTVTGVRADGVTGPKARSTVKAAPKKPVKKKKRK